MSLQGSDEIGEGITEDTVLEVGILGIQYKILGPLTPSKMLLVSTWVSTRVSQPQHFCYWRLCNSMVGAVLCIARCSAASPAPTH